MGHVQRPQSESANNDLQLGDHDGTVVTHRCRGSKRSPESGSIRLVMTAPPIIDGGWLQALAITNRVANLPSANDLATIPNIKRLLR
jgi:hypothetical protein